jgi:transposase-like protein
MSRSYAIAKESVEFGNPDRLVEVPWAMEDLALPLNEQLAQPSCEIRRFSSDGAVVVRDSMASVFIGGLLIGTFNEDADDRGPRNILAVTLAKSGQLHLGHLASAFGMTDEYLRILRRKEEARGLGSVLGVRQGKVSKVSPELRAAWCAMFDAGQMPIDAHREQPRKDRRAYSTVWRVYSEWSQDRSARSAASLHETEPPREDQLPLWGTAAAAEAAATSPVTPDEAATADQVTPDEDGQEILPMTAAPVRGGHMVQHVGCWILLALANELGLHDDADRAFGQQYHDGLRIALDAVICALAIYQRCIEGVRRLATPTGPTLLRADRVPTASGVRKLFGRLLSETEIGGAILDARVTTRFIAAAHADEGPAVFYVDGHLRRYHGKQVVRKGWRMQDRRVLPGSTDYYVHDEDGRPVFRIPVTSHDSLTAWLQPIAKRLREGLGAEERILLAFDRGGAFSKQLAALRDAGIEFVTYERAPYPTIAESKFDRTVVVRGETYQLHESRNKNLGDKRGRIRRIALRAADGKQINLVAISTASAEQLVAILLGGPSIKLPSGRWQQENAFHHGDARWGINQLDDRAVEPYPPGTIIPNPARRRLDQSLRLARAAEGDARRKLACTTPELGALRRAAVEQDLADALKLQQELEALRPQTPTHAPIEDTALAGKLVRHTGQLKRIVDVIRVVCANAESELATLIAPHMGRPREAKKVIANILAAPGKVTVTDQAIHVRLAPAANRSERDAMQHLFAAINQRGLVLPSDPKRLPLRFDLQPL